jgi:isochorismate synthase
LYQRQTRDEEWTRWVQEALQAIETGQLSKLVLARKMSLSGDEELPLEAVLQRLSSAYPECAVFAVGNGASVFLGATPETLVRLEDGALSLSCLAGTAARGASEEEDQCFGRDLLNSPKDLQEHGMVVNEVAKALQSACTELHWNATPRLVRLRNVQHLGTFFTGRTKAPGNILQLVESLHPTPAVGGVPTRLAVEAIRRIEGDRGWYAAPVGWVDPNGQGEFNVAIRSALLRGNEATLFAGSGIVLGSDPQLEFQETQLKFNSLLSALGGTDGRL